MVIVKLVPEAKAVVEEAVGLVLQLLQPVVTQIKVTEQM